MEFLKPKVASLKTFLLRYYMSVYLIEKKMRELMNKGLTPDIASVMAHSTFGKIDEDTLEMMREENRLIAQSLSDFIPVEEAQKLSMTNIDDKDKDTNIQCE